MSKPVNLTGIPETMLWTLHNRASEARRPDGLIVDHQAVRIYDAIDYDFVRSFGEPDGTHAIRSKLFDEAVRPWLARHPGGTVIELGCGLETQYTRVDDGRVQWFCIDVPEAITVRERFLPASERCRHVRKSALDYSWMEEVPARDVFITAQGLFMYFHENEVRALIAAMASHFESMQLMFDVIPRWFSNKTLSGFSPTAHYEAPPMPWGINHSDIVPTLRRWSPHIGDITLLPYRRFRGIGGLMVPLFSRLPLLREWAPSLVLLSAHRTTH